MNRYSVARHRMKFPCEIDATRRGRIANFLSIIEFAIHRLLAPVDMLRVASLTARIRRCARSVVGFWPNKEEKFLVMLPATVDQGDRSRSSLS